MTADTWIALGALLISALVGIHSIRTSHRLNILLQKNAEYELRVNEEAEKLARSADVTVELERHPTQIVLWNTGGAAAGNVNLEVRSIPGGQNPIQRDGGRKLPLPRLEPGSSCSLSARVFWEQYTGFDCMVTWRDPDGTEQRKELKLYT